MSLNTVTKLDKLKAAIDALSPHADNSFIADRDDDRGAFVECNYCFGDITEHSTEFSHDYHCPVTNLRDVLLEIEDE